MARFKMANSRLEPARMPFLLVPRDSIETGRVARHQTPTSRDRLRPSRQDPDLMRLSSLIVLRTAFLPDRMLRSLRTTRRKDMLPTSAATIDAMAENREKVETNLDKAKTETATTAAGTMETDETRLLAIFRLVLGEETKIAVAVTRVAVIVEATAAVIMPLLLRLPLPMVLSPR